MFAIKYFKRIEIFNDMSFNLSLQWHVYEKIARLAEA